MKTIFVLDKSFTKEKKCSQMVTWTAFKWRSGFSGSALCDFHVISTEMRTMRGWKESRLALWMTELNGTGKVKGYFRENVPEIEPAIELVHLLRGKQNAQSIHWK